MKTCQECGAPYTKRPNEAHQQYARRQFCSFRCSNKAARDASAKAAAEAARAIIEDLTFLADHGVGATEAARRCGMTGSDALDRYLRRWGQVPLLNRLTFQDWLPVGHKGPQRSLRRAS